MDRGFIDRDVRRYLGNAAVARPEIGRTFAPGHTHRR